MKSMSPAPSTDASVTSAHLSRRKHRERTCDAQSGASTSVYIPSREQSPFAFDVDDTDQSGPAFDRASYVNIGRDGSDEDWSEDDMSSRGARSPLTRPLTRHGLSALSPRGGTPASAASGASSETSSDSESDSDAVSESTPPIVRARSYTPSSHASGRSSPLTRPVPSSPYEPKERVDLRQSPAPTAAPALEFVQPRRPSPSLKQSAGLIACGVGVTVGAMLLASQTQALWQPPATRLLQWGQQQFGEHVVNPISESLSRGALWLSRFGHHPAPAPLPYDPQSDWREIAMRLHRLDRHILQAGGLAIDGGDGV